MRKRDIMTEKQYQQSLENAVARGIFNSACNEYDNERITCYRKLRNCQARVYSTTNYYILQSYETFVAAIDKRNYAIADVLRDVYCYTSTSAQHISKFIHDYTPLPYDSPRYTFRDIH